MGKENAVVCQTLNNEWERIIIVEAPFVNIDSLSVVFKLRVAMRMRPWECQQFVRTYIYPCPVDRLNQGSDE